MANIITDTNYYTVHGWMRNQLGLKGNSLIIYAIIYGFSQTEHQEFTASINYLCEWTGASRPTVINSLKELVKNGLLTKKSHEINGVIYNQYRAVIPDLAVVHDFTGGKKILPVEDLTSKKTLLVTSKKILPNNNSICNTEKSFPTEKRQSPEKKSTYKDIFTDPAYSVVSEALQKYIKVLKGMSYTPRVSTVKSWADFLVERAKDNPEIAMLYVDQSISKGWKSLYELKDEWKNKTGVSGNVKREVFDPKKDELADVVY